MRAPTVPTHPQQLKLPMHVPAAPEFVFARVFRRLGVKRGVPNFQIEYRPFSSLRSRIELRGNQARVCLPDLLEQAPPIVLEALAEILLAQLFRRRASQEARECYMAYIFDPAVRERVHETRRKRGRVRLLPPQGRRFDLAAIFSRLNQQFFGGELPVCQIGWSPTASRTVLGRYDPSHHAITISRLLDAANVPTEVVEYLVFHEMLHIRFPLKRSGDRRVVHSNEFRVAEKRFPHYKKARSGLKKLLAE